MYDTNFEKISGTDAPFPSDGFFLLSLKYMDRFEAYFVKKFTIGNLNTSF